MKIIHQILKLIPSMIFFVYNFLVAVYVYHSVLFLFRITTHFSYEIYGISYTSKWPKNAVKEIVPRDLTCIQTSNWPKYFGPKRKGKNIWAILKFECMSSHVALSLSQQFWAILRCISYHGFYDSESVWQKVQSKKGLFWIRRRKCSPGLMSKVSSFVF